MLKRFTILFRYTKQGEKKAGPVQRYAIYASSLDEAMHMAERYANYPNIELLEVKQT